MNKEPLVSIIVPIYNVQDYIRKCIDSIKKQSYTNIEIILINDGSTDNSGNICQKEAKRDARIKYINQKNSGVSVARNKGLDISRGFFITFVDSDDEIDEFYVEKLVKNAVKHHSDIAICGYNDILPQNQNLTGKQALIKLLLQQESLDIVPWGKLYKKELYFKFDIRYPENKINEDTLTTYKLYANSKKISYINDSLYKYIQRKGSITNREKRIIQLQNREQAAIEAIEYLHDQPEEVKEAAHISLLTAKIAFIDNYILGYAPKKYFESAVDWIKQNKHFESNRFYTKKLKLYVFMITKFNGILYKTFRKLIH